jgi:hypothetical protein
MGVANWLQIPLEVQIGAGVSSPFEQLAAPQGVPVEAPAQAAPPELLPDDAPPEPPVWPDVLPPTQEPPTQLRPGGQLPSEAHKTTPDPTGCGRHAPSPEASTAMKRRPPRKRIQLFQHRFASSAR